MDNMRKVAKQEVKAHEKRMHKGAKGMKKGGIATSLKAHAAVLLARAPSADEAGGAITAVEPPEATMMAREVPAASANAEAATIVAMGRMSVSPSLPGYRPGLAVQRGSEPGIAL